MTPEFHKKSFDIFGRSFVSEQHADLGSLNLQQATGGAIAWAGFYALAIVVVMSGGFQKTANIVLASVN